MWCLRVPGGHCRQKSALSVKCQRSGWVPGAHAQSPSASGTCIRGHGTHVSLFRSQPRPCRAHVSFALLATISSLGGIRRRRFPPCHPDQPRQASKPQSRQRYLACLRGRAPRTAPRAPIHVPRLLMQSVIAIQSKPFDYSKAAYRWPKERISGKLLRPARRLPASPPPPVAFGPCSARARRQTPTHVG